MGIGFGFFQIMFSLVFIIVFGMVIEGDQGRLTFQGTRYLGFERL